MTTATQPRTRRIEGVVPERTVLGPTLAAIGAIVLTGFVVPDVERFTLLAVSAVLLVAFAVSREYGFAIPAGITGGIGTMIFLVTAGSLDPSQTPAVVLLSVAGGFASIWLLGLAALPRTTHPWPLVPALVLGLLGSAFAFRQPGAIDWIQAGVALALVTAGTAMVLRRDHR
ncbi:MAG: hypothetical protein ACJ77O_03340 [Chloroflexota bacterium]